MLVRRVTARHGRRDLRKVREDAINTLGGSRGTSKRRYLAQATGTHEPPQYEIIRKVDGNGVEYTGTVSGCDICAVGKSTQKAHPKKDQHKTDEPMKLVYADLMGPITPAVRGGYKYVSNFTDDFCRMQEVFLLTSKTEVVDSLYLYNMTVAAPLGLRFQRRRCDK